MENNHQLNLNTNNRTTLIVTCALPYANGELHLGHLVEQIQADIWVRFHKMQDIKCYFICGADSHGTPIMLKAESLGITPEELITATRLKHIEDFSSFGISFDHYYTTHSQENKELVEEIYLKLNKANKITTKVIKQFYDEEKQMFLPDRFIKGTCPKCMSTDQYGDSCDSCGAIYAPTDLVNPYSTLSHTTPSLKESVHYFFKLSECSEFLKDWLKNSKLQVEAKNKLQEWINAGLNDWDISRDKPYFGFNIPNTTDKYFYVWLDAPIGYISSFANYCKIQNLNFDEIFNDEDTKLYHFIGKDILYFHALFWPSVLKYANYKLPEQIFTHGFLTVNGQKMSKSRGTFINIKQFNESNIPPDFFRYYIASKFNDKIEDIDLNLEDFMLRNNSELIGKFINIAARSSSFINKHFNLTLSDQLDVNLIDEVRSIELEVSNLYKERNFNKLIRSVMTVVDKVNNYVDTEKPWLLSKNPDELTHLHKVCTTLINAFYLITIYLKPIIPHITCKIEEFLNTRDLKWSNLEKLLLNHTIKPYTHLAGRIEQNHIDKLIQK